MINKTKDFKLLVFGGGQRREVEILLWGEKIEISLKLFKKNENLPKHEIFSRGFLNPFLGCGGGCNNQNYSNNYKYIYIMIMCFT